jgi:ribokinase
MVGSDAFGRESLARLEAAGVDVTEVGVAPGESGVALITVSNEGANSIVVVPGANAAVTPEYLESKRSVVAMAGMVLAQLEIPLETVVRLAEMCEQEQVPLMLDPAPAAPLPDSLLTRCAWITPNETEAKLYAGNAGKRDPAAVAASLLARGVDGVVLKLGARGSYLAMRSRVHERVRAFAVKAVDSTAAGDTFNGAFAVGLMQGASPADAARFAAGAAAISVTREGAQASMPTLEEVEEFLRERSARLE